MKRLGLLLLLGLFYSPFTFAQETTLRPDDGSAVIEGDYHKVLLVPYDPRLYSSGIDASIAQETGLSYHQIKSRMRHGLTMSMVGSSTTVLPTVSLFDSEDDQVAKDLGYVYNSIGYQYTEVPVESTQEEAEPETGARRLVGKFTRLTQREPEEDRYIGGEEEAPYADEPERYMNTTIHNPNLLNYLATQYEADVFLFINQLDITSEVGNDSYSYARQANKRKIKVHFTIFDLQGKQLYGGTSVVYFPAKVNDLNGIIKGYFPSAADIIAGHLPQRVLTPEEAARKEDMERKADAQRQEITNN